jgi:hypothetical protein
MPASVAVERKPVMNRLSSVAAALLLLSFSATALSAPPPLPPSGAAPAGAPAASGSVALLYKFTVGQVLTYHMTMSNNVTTSVAGQTILANDTVDMTLVNTIQSIDSAGNATIVGQVQNVNTAMTMNGQPTPMPQSSIDQLKSGTTTVLSPQGKIVSMKFNAEPAGGGPMDPSTLMSAMGSFSLLPSSPVKVNDTWRTTIPMPMFSSPMFVKMALLGLDTSSGSTIADISSKYYSDLKMAPSAGTPLAMTGQMSGAGNSKFDVDKGYMSSTSANMTMDMSMTPPSTPGADVPTGKMTMRMVMAMKLNLVGAS